MLASSKRQAIRSRNAPGSAGGVSSRAGDRRDARFQWRRLVVAGALALVLVACGSAEDAGGANHTASPAAAPMPDAGTADAGVRDGIGTPFDGRPYLGSVEVRADVPGQGAGAIRDSGRGSIHLERNDAGVALVLAGNIKVEGDASFFLDGRRADGGWRSRSEEVQVGIDADGTVAGHGRMGDQQLRFDGRVSPTDFDLDVEVTLAAASAKGLPAGTRFVFAYRLRRDAGDGPATASDGADDEARTSCRRFVWRVRNIADFSGGPMRMIQVPECVG